MSAISGKDQGNRINEQPEGVNTGVKPLAGLAAGPLGLPAAVFGDWGSS